MLNSLRLFETLTSAHFPEPQARAIVQAIGSALDDRDTELGKALAAKVDKDTFGGSMLHLETSLKQEISALREEMRREFVAMRGEVSVKIAETKSQLLYWMFAFWVGQLAAMVALFKLLK